MTIRGGNRNPVFGEFVGFHPEEGHVCLET